MYNTRRGNFGRGGNTPGGNNRRSMQGNFVPGGQLRPNNQGGVQQQQQQQTPQKPAQQQRNETPVKNTQAQAANEQQNNTTAAPPQPVVVKKEAPTPKPKVEAAPPAPVLTTPAAPPANPPAEGNPPAAEDETMETDETKPRPPWMKKNKGKISKAEKVKRRNMRLRKILQPKNALMVLNEIAGATTYELNEVQPNNMFGNHNQANFKATVLVDGQVHEGYGKNKPAAKTAAAEAALKHLVLTRITAADSQPQTEEDTKPATETPAAVGNGEEAANGEKMEVEEKEDDISYCHLASFALYKLFSSWDDGGKIMSRSNSHSNLSTSGDSAKLLGVKNTPEMRPSKKMPEHPELMNPVMLLNQMYPHAVYEEVCKSGIPPKITFTMKCTIEGKSFIGNGANKKVARREAAFQACRELLNVAYPQEVA